jgi:hypothetical protein
VKSQATKSLSIFGISCPQMNMAFKKIFYSYVHTTFGSFLPPSHTPSLTYFFPSLFPANPSLPGRNYFVLISNFVEERVLAIIGRTKGFC